jgi:hypothetical protein
MYINFVSLHLSTVGCLNLKFCSFGKFGVNSVIYMVVEKLRMIPFLFTNCGY